MDTIVLDVLLLWAVSSPSFNCPIANSSGTDGLINCASADLNLSTTSTPLGSIDGIDGFCHLWLAIM